MADTKNPPVSGYKLEAPDRALAISSLKRFLSDEVAETLWKRHCDDCNVSDKTSNLEELSTVFKSMAEESGAIGVVGKSLTVRVISYRILSKTSKR